MIMKEEEEEGEEERWKERKLNNSINFILLEK